MTLRNKDLIFLGEIVSNDDFAFFVLLKNTPVSLRDLIFLGEIVSNADFTFFVLLKVNPTDFKE